MIFPFFRKSKFKTCLHELKAAILGQTIGFAADVTEEFDSLIARRLFGLSSQERSYPRLFSNGPPTTATTDLNQMILSVGALAFYLHALDRLSFRPHSEALREAIFDPVAISLSETFAEMLTKQSIKATASDTLDGIQGLGLRYAEAPSLAGTSPQDKNSAVWLAATAIAEDASHPNSILVPVISGKLMHGLVAMDLANRIKALEAIL